MRDSVSSKPWKQFSTQSASKTMRSERSSLSEFTDHGDGARDDSAVVQFADSPENVSAVSPSQDQAAVEQLEIPSGPLRHPSLMIKFGFLSVLQASAGRFSTRWCNLNVTKFRMFSRNNTLKMSIIMGTIERVDSVFSSQSNIAFPIVLHRKRKHRSVPVVLSASNSTEQMDWITVAPLPHTFIPFSCC
jgi:hypothetical protein